MKRRMTGDRVFYIEERYRREHAARRPAARGRETVVRELTAQGRHFCAAAGLIEELAVLWWFGISLSAAPFFVLCFLWFLFAVLSAAALIGIDDICTVCRQAYRRYRRVARLMQRRREIA